MTHPSPTIPSRASSTALILIGMPSAGKTTIGRPLAREAGLAFRDTDDLIRERTGRELKEIIRNQGLQEFMRIETAAVRALRAAPMVIATGGSVIYDDAAMDHLAGLGRLVYLYWPLKTLQERVGDLDQRGVVHRPDQDLAALFAERHPLYAARARQVVDCRDKSVADIIADIRAWRSGDPALAGPLLERLAHLEIARPPTVTDLSRAVARRLNLGSGPARKALKALARSGRLEFRDHCGHIVVGRAMHGPVEMAPGVYLKPQGHPFTGGPGEVVIALGGGAAFGSGRHPTTRLALQMLAAGLPQLRTGFPREKLQGLDVGTGTGVLALAAVRLGLHHCVAVDTDPTARYEARQNAALNQLAEQITIPDQLPAAQSAGCHMILANLRYPTLVSLADTFWQWLKPGGQVIVSGLKPADRSALAGAYGQKGFLPEGETRQGQWMAMRWIKPWKPARGAGPE